MVRYVRSRASDRSPTVVGHAVAHVTRAARRNRVTYPCRVGTRVPYPRGRKTNITKTETFAGTPVETAALPRYYIVSTRAHEIIFNSHSACAYYCFFRFRNRTTTNVACVSRVLRPETSVHVQRPDRASVIDGNRSGVDGTPIAIRAFV